MPLGRAPTLHLRLSGLGNISAGNVGLGSPHLRQGACPLNSRYSPAPFSNFLPVERRFVVSTVSMDSAAQAHSTHTQGTFSELRENYMPASPFTPLAFGQGSKPLGSREPLATYKGHSHEIEPSKVGSVLPDRSERRADSRGFVIDAGSESPVPRGPGFVIPLSPGNNYGRVPPNLSVWTTTTQSFSPSEVSQRSHFVGFRSFSRE
jgi:hypothetical protein